MFAEKEHAIRRNEEEFGRRRQLIKLKYQNYSRAENKSYHRIGLTNPFSQRSQSPQSNHSRHT